MLALGLFIPSDLGGTKQALAGGYSDRGGDDAPDNGDDGDDGSDDGDTGDTGDTGDAPSGDSSDNADSGPGEGGDYQKGYSHDTEPNDLFPAILYFHARCLFGRPGNWTHSLDDSRSVELCTTSEKQEVIGHWSEFLYGDAKNRK